MNQARLNLKALTLSLFALAIFALAHVDGHQRLILRYQNRGDRYEGIKGLPVSDKVDLISAVVEHSDDLPYVPPQFKLRFYLKEPTSAFITVRESDNKHNYWLDRVKPNEPWRIGYGNEFQWTTESVIKPIGQIHLGSLGAVVQLDHDEPRIDIKVAPAVLYQAVMPRSARGYLFTFKVGRKADVTCLFSKNEDNSPVLVAEQFLDVRGQRPKTVRWDASTAREGWYRLRIKVIYKNNAQEVNKIVRFYHRPSIN